MRKLSTYVVAATVLVALALCPVAARADSTTFDLTTPSTQSGSLYLYTGPYASITVNLTSSTTADITFNSLTQGAYTYWMGDGKTIGLNVNATMFSVSNIVDAGYQQGVEGSGLGGIPVGGAPETFDKLGCNPGCLNQGTFNFWINNKEGPLGNNPYPAIVNTLSFTLTDTSGTWSQAADVLFHNLNGFEAASHMFATTSTCIANKNCDSGYAGGYGPVPEPPVNALLACSALLFGGLFLRRPLWS